MLSLCADNTTPDSIGMLNTSHRLVTPVTSHPGTDQVVLISCASLVSLSAVALNVIVLTTIVRTPSLRRLQNVLVASLASADLLRATVVIPFYMAALTGCTWLRVNSPGCVLYRVMFITTQMAVVYGATFIGVERAFLIGRPLLYQRVVTQRRMMIFVAVGWIVCVVFGVLQSGLIRPVDDSVPDAKEVPITGSSHLTLAVDAYKFSSTVCFKNQSISNVSLDLFIGLIFPFIILVTSYAVIFCIVRSQMRRIAPPPSTTGGGVLSDDGRATGSNTWMTSLSASASKNIKDSEVVTDDRPNIATISGHVHVRRILVTSSLRRQSTHSLTRVNPTGRVLDGIAEDEVTQRDEQDTSGPLHAIGVATRMSTSSSEGVRDTISNCNHRPATCGQIDADLQVRENEKDVGDVRLPITSPLRPVAAGFTTTKIFVKSRTLSDAEALSTRRGSNTSTASNRNRRRVSIADNHLPAELFQPNDIEPPFSGYRPNAATTSRLVDDVDDDRRAPRTRSVSLSVEPVEKMSSATLAARRSSGPPTAGRRFKSTMLPSAGDAKTIPEESSTTGSLGGGVPRPSVVSVALGSLRGVQVAKWRPTISKNKAARMTLIVIGTFLACWSPICVCHFKRVFDADVSSSTVSNLAIDITVLVSFVASLVDPLVYNFYSAEFRRSAVRVMTCNRNKSGSPFY